MHKPKSPNQKRTPPPHGFLEEGEEADEKAEGRGGEGHVMGILYIGAEAV